MTGPNRTALRIVRDDEASRAAPLGRRIRHALVCLDGSAHGDVCLAFASMMAEAFAAELTLTHVLPAPQFGSGIWTRTDVLEWEIARREADRYLDGARAMLGACGAMDVRTIVSQGAPSDRIATTAREVGADLVVLAGSANGACATVLGGTAQRVLASSVGSVLIAHGSATVPPRHLVVPLDGSARTESVFPTVVALARTYRAAVTLVHVVCERPSSAVLASASDLQLAGQLTERLKHNADDYLARVRERELRDLPEVRCVVRARTDDRRALLAIAAQLDADMLVLAAHGASCDGDGPFGSVASHLLAHSRIPLLVLQDVAAPPMLEVAGPSARPSMIRRREEA